MLFTGGRGGGRGYCSKDRINCSLIFNFFFKAKMKQGELKSFLMSFYGRTICGKGEEDLSTSLFKELFQSKKKRDLLNECRTVSFFVVFVSYFFFFHKTFFEKETSVTVKLIILLLFFLCLTFLIFVLSESNHNLVLLCLATFKAQFLQFFSNIFFHFWVNWSWDISR